MPCLAVHVCALFFIACAFFFDIRKQIACITLLSEMFELKSIRPLFCGCFFFIIFDCQDVRITSLYGYLVYGIIYGYSTMGNRKNESKIFYCFP